MSVFSGIAYTAEYEEVKPGGRLAAEEYSRFQLSAGLFSVEYELEIDHDVRKLGFKCWKMLNYIW